MHRRAGTHSPMMLVQMGPGSAAHRLRAAPRPGHESRLCRLADRNLEGADAIDPAFDSVAGRECGDPGWRSRHDDIAGTERDLLRQFGDDFGHAPDQFREIALLPFAGWPIFEAGCRAPQGAEWSNDFPTSHGRSFLRAASCRSRRVRSMPTP